jgi:hypothetical protein
MTAGVSSITKIDCETPPRRVPDTSFARGETIA